MLILFETPAGYALFKLLDKGKLKQVDDLAESFSTPEKAQQVVKLKAFSKFADTTAACEAASAICDGVLHPSLKEFLKQNVADVSKKLAVADSKLGGLIKQELGMKCVYDNTILELLRGIRTQMDSLLGLSEMSETDRKAMKLGLSHSLCRYKLKFSPDKVDTMIIQAISLLDELDKELNTYAMRVREWYGWHFPEMTKIVQDNILYAKAVKKMGVRTNCSKTDLSDVLPEDVEKELKEAAEVSMGTEVAEEDINNIQHLCDQVITIHQYRSSLYEYLRNRMMAIAPNLTTMVGELVGARLVSHAGSLMSLAKHPASTVQILGAEKALFRALKTKHATPKYGLIYHASLIGQAPPKFKGKLARVLAAKTSLAVRMDALGDTDQATIGLEHRLRVENRLRELEGGKAKSLSGTGKGKSQQQKFTPTPAKQYNAAADSALDAKTMPAPAPTTPAASATPAAPALTEKEQRKKEKKEKKKREEEEKAKAEAAAAKPEEKKEEKKEEGEKKKKDKGEKRKRYFEEEGKPAEAAAPAAPAAAPAATSEDEEKKEKKKKKKQKLESQTATPSS